MSEEERFYLLLDSYLAGDAKTADVRIIREWLAADPKRAEIVEDLRRIRDVARAGKSHRSSEEAWRRLLPTLGRGLPDAPPASGGLANSLRRLSDWAESKKSIRPNWTLAAAMLVLAVAVPTAVTYVVSWRGGVARDRASGESVRSIATARGQREEVRLADGSLVTLAPNSQLSVLSMARDAREVRLEGEAYFDVVHDERRPFTVRAHNTTVKDVGTRFAVRAYAVDTLVRVVVTHGQVLVRPDFAADSSGMLLDPRMIARVNSAGAIAVERNADTTRYVAFKRGQIVFVGTPLIDVARELERWYDVQIRLADPAMGKRRVTATIADQTLPDLLDQLRIALNVRVFRDGEFIVLSDKPSPQHPAR
jgi:transmembrane sensor